MSFNDNAADKNFLKFVFFVDGIAFIAAHRRKKTLGLRLWQDAVAGNELLLYRKEIIYSLENKQNHLRLSKGM